ncbi:MAG: hypothetical protein A2096_10630 [Spirochaetes bacterium GWF1_41_5]|nr:MAG: hypothetical protein A2096_10630 [Spirochaetes bacterium GWF1_41_5]
MEIQVTQRYLRSSRRKIAKIGNALKKLTVKKAKAQLFNFPQRAGAYILKAIKAAENNYLQKTPNVDTDKLLILNIMVNQGPTLKRIMPRARGSADRINKRTSHLTIILTDQISKIRLTKKTKKYQGEE